MAISHLLCSVYLHVGQRNLIPYSYINFVQAEQQAFGENLEGAPSTSTADEPDVEPCTSTVHEEMV